MRQFLTKIVELGFTHFVQDTVMSVLLTQLPKDVRRDRLTTDVLLSAYVNKLIKINNDHDKWSLVSLSNNKGYHKLNFSVHYQSLTD